MNLDPTFDTQDGHETTDPLGVAGTFPRPGWVVIDAIRESGFTGEVVLASLPPVTVYADRGRIYAAERAGDPPLGAQLVAVGVLTAAELEQGVIRLGDTEQLGRLFERVPTADRDAVLAVNDLINDECLGWLAGERVHGAAVTPYRHHPSGLHRWEAQPELPAPLAPAFAPPPTGAPVVSLPAPVAAPVTMPAPATVPYPAPAPAHELSIRFDLEAPLPVFTDSMAPPLQPAGVSSPPEPAAGVEHGDLDMDEGVIRWDEPGFLDQPFVGEISLGLVKPLRSPTPRPVASAPTPLDPDDDPSGERLDWTESFDGGVTLHAGDPLARPAAMPLPSDPGDRFEVIWPSGEVDEQFGGRREDAVPHPDIDRAGPTARLVRDGGFRPLGTATALKAPDAVDEAVADAIGGGVDDIETWLASEIEREEPAVEQSEPEDNAVVLAVRRAVASIETGSLGTRDRRSGPRGLTIGTLDARLDTRLDGLVPPGRVAVRSEATGEIPLTATGRMSRPHPSAGSVFDEVPPALPAPSSTTDADGVFGTDGVERVSALRRLIGSLRRR